MNALRLYHYASVFILLAWASVLLYFFTSGRVNALLTENFRVLPLVAGLGLLVVALFNLFTANAAGGCCDHEHDHDHGHDENEGCCGHDDHPHDHHHHHHHEAHHEAQKAEIPPHRPSHDDHTLMTVLATAVIVLVPLIGGASLARDRFSKDTLVNKGLYDNDSGASREKPAAKASAKPDESNPLEYTLADLEKQVRRSPEGNFMIPVASLFYSAADEELARVLAGQPVETTGQVVPEISENDPEGTRLRLYRLFVSCCLADARPLAFSIDFGKTPPKLPEESWVKVVGKMAYPEVENRKVPILEVDSIETIPEPEDALGY